jgi:hypothetical protein
MNHMNRPRTSGGWYWWSAAIYLILLVGIVWGLVSARRWAIAELATPQSTAEWDAWRADVRAEQDQPTPVRRAIPKSAEPPALVLMRDYFRVSLTGAVLFSSVLFWICTWLLHGMLSAPAMRADQR